MIARAGGQWFFTMELVRGHDLLEVLIRDEASRTSASASESTVAIAARQPTVTLDGRPRSA